MGSNEDSNFPSPIMAAGIDGVNLFAETVSANSQHSCTVLDTAQVYCWGANYNGQLGRGNFSDLFAHIPAEVVNINNALAVSAGFSHSCAVLITGSVQC